VSKTVLIAGGAGFIGSHLCDFFLKMDYLVIAVDNLITGNINNLKNSFKNSNFKFINHDIINPLNVNCSVDYILNFASPASPKFFIKYPLETLFSGSFGTKNLIELAIEKNAKILVASTSEIYGDPLEHPQKESYYGNVNTTGPRSVYDESKRFQETLVYSYHKKNNLDISIARIFNTYGPRMDILDGRVVPNFIINSLNSDELHIYGDGKQTRSFCYIDDMVDGLYKLLLSNTTMPINLGNPDEITIEKLADEIIDLSGKKINKKYFPIGQNDPKKRKPDISMAIDKLNWKPQISRKVGIEKTFEYFSQQIKS
jgi:dTDP-glucose 4,6-dehydratase